MIAQLALNAFAFVAPAVRLGGSALSKAAVARAPATTATMSLGSASAASDAIATTMTTAMGLEVNFGGFLAIILGTLVPVIFLIIIFIKSNAEGTATTFRWPDLDGGGLFDADGSQSRFGTLNGFVKKQDVVAPPSKKKK
ncbi:hypothetical protein T492DRAFT_1096636 [Pavlovales sp. CCMP2436]|nr:hypothetical protein T492DRAFT_1096636 [Pavlovales sp. CCMP2436]